MLIVGTNFKITTMAKYSEKAQDAVKSALHREKNPDEAEKP